MDLGIRGKRALILGGSSGLGKGIAKSLSQEGARVAICARSEDQLKKTAQEIGAELALTCDLSKAGEGRRIAEATVAKLGGVDILVTNAGGPPKGSFEDITPEKWLSGFQGLWLSAVEAIQASLPGMKAQKWGRILLVTSISSKEPLGGLTVSNGLRPGLMGMANSLSREVAASGVTVNVLLPGYTDTERLRELGIPMEKISSQVPAGRVAQPEELGDLAAFLASARAAYVTGQAIACDGGFLKSI